MKKNLLMLIMSLGCWVQAVPVGNMAPDFSLTGSDGKTWKLSEQKGKVVVLEWFNEGCPFVKKHYASGNMQSLQKTMMSRGVVWFTILSSAPGKQGYVSGAQLAKDLFRLKANPSAALLDPSGQVGKLFGAKTTPHMFVIDPQGKLVYDGAMDDNSSADPETVLKAKNYVRDAVEAVLAGQPVPQPVTKPYGCAVKYQN